MIEEAPLLTARRTIARPPADLVAAFKGVPNAFICDAMGGAGALDYRIKAVAGPESFVGVALTCACGPADNLAIAAAAAMANPGDVIMAAVDGFTGAAVVGDLLAGMMKNRGVVAFVTDGVVRDRPDLIKIGLTCCAMGVTPNSCHRSGPGTVGLPVVVGGVAVAAGDIVVGDLDGVVVVPQAQARHVLARLDSIKGQEHAMLAKVHAGLDTPPFGAELIESGRVRFVE